MTSYFYGKILQPVMDLDYDLSCSFHTPEILERKISMLAEYGFSRLHIVAPPYGNADYSHAARMLPEDGPPNFLRQSREAFGTQDPLAVAIDFAKAADLEVIIVFKPYEGGGVFTIPHNATPPAGQNYIETIGGRSIGLAPFIVAHPEFLIQRKPIDQKLDETVEKIELVFMLDKIDDTSEVRQSFLGDDAVSIFPATNFKLSISEDNGQYHECDIDAAAIRDYVDFRTITNANGERIFLQPVRCRVIELSNLKITAPYFAVDFDGQAAAFRTIPFSMCSAFSADGKLPVTVSPTLRHGKTYHEVGFEFEEVGPYYWDCGWRECTYFGFARGKMQRLRGSLCEVYPQVQKHWLDHIQRFVDMDVDGVEIRLQSHCSGVTDFVNYNFNQPLVDAYASEYGVDILSQPVDPIKMMELRGRFYIDFVEQAAALLHADGRKLLHHLHGYMERPTLTPTFPELGFWANPKILPSWRRLIEISDELVIKDYNWGKYDFRVADEIKNFASCAGKPLWLHCYLQQGNDWNKDFLTAAAADSRITGLLLYEVVWNERENIGIVKVDEDGSTTWVLPEI